MVESKEVLIDYTNWRGVRSLRRIRPTGRMTWAKNEWHPEEQWLMEAVDLEKGETREFALASIHAWVRPLVT